MICLIKKAISNGQNLNVMQLWSFKQDIELSILCNVTRFEPNVKKTLSFIAMDASVVRLLYRS